MKKRLFAVTFVIVFIVFVCCLYLFQNILCFEGEVTEKNETGIRVEVTENIKELSSDSPAYYVHRDGCYTSVSDHSEIFISETDISGRVYRDLQVGDRIRVHYYFDGQCDPAPLSSLESILRVKVAE